MEIAFGHFGDIEPGGAAAAGIGDIFVQFRRRIEFENFGGEGSGMAVGKEHAGSLDYFAEAIDIGSNKWLARAHALDRGEGEAFEVGGHDYVISSMEQSRDVRAYTEEMHTPCHACL